VTDTLEKVCTACDKKFPATTEYFHRNKRNKNKLKSQCKTCCSAKNKQWRENNKDYDRKRHRKYRQENLSEVIRKEKEYKHKNRSHIRETERLYWKAHKEQERENNRKSYIRHREQRIEYQRQRRREMGHKKRIMLSEQEKLEARKKRFKKYYAQNKAYMYARWTKYTSERPGYRATIQSRRRMRKKKVLGEYTYSQIQGQLKRQRYCCYYAACGFAKFSKVDGKYIFEIEHTFPVSRIAGTDIPGNDISYLVLACPACNASKKDKFPWEWPEGGRLL
jgi:HNH endonuclease